MIVLVHVDDCTIVGTSHDLITKFKSEITKHVEITDLGEIHWILGIEICQNRELCTIHLCQHSYIEFSLWRYGFEDIKPVSLPMDTSIKLTSAQSPSTTEEIAQMCNIPYHEAISTLMYASLGTQPDITYTVKTVSHFSKNPGYAHWEAVKKIFCYLKDTKDLWLSYGGQQKELIGYADADGIWPKIAMWFQGMHLFCTEVLFLGVLNDRRLFHSLLQRVSTLRPHMPWKRPFGFVHLSLNSSTPHSLPPHSFLTISQRSRSPNVEQVGCHGSG